MEKQRVRTGKPSKMFVYLPVYLVREIEEQEGDENKKPTKKAPVYQRTAIKELPFSRVEKGDSFIVKKRDNIQELIESKDELKVKQVKRSFIDGSCIIVLEKMVFTEKEELNEFLKNKRSV